MSAAGPLPAASLRRAHLPPALGGTPACRRPGDADELCVGQERQAVRGGYGGRA